MSKSIEMRSERIIAEQKRLVHVHGLNPRQIEDFSLRHHKRSLVLIFAKVRLFYLGDMLEGFQNQQNGLLVDILDSSHAQNPDSFDKSKISGHRRENPVSTQTGTIHGRDHARIALRKKISA